jgi:hypothetical protein
MTKHYWVIIVILIVALILSILATAFAVKWYNDNSNTINKINGEDTKFFSDIIIDYDKILL